MRPKKGSRGLYVSWDDGLDQLPIGAHMTNVNALPTQVLFDVAVSDEVESVLDATEHPVEAGGDITDNARLRMLRFSFDVVVSDTPLEDPDGTALSNGGAMTQSQLTVPQAKRQFPINPLGAAVEGALIGVSAVAGLISGPSEGTNLTALQWDSPFDRVSDMLALLRRLQENVKILKIVTSKYIFENVLLTNVKQMRDREIGSGARYRLEFKQLRLVTLEFTDSPEPAEPRGGQPKNKGVKQPQQKKIKKQSVGSALITDSVASLKAALGLQ